MTPAGSAVTARSTGRSRSSAPPRARRCTSDAAMARASRRRPAPLRASSATGVAGASTVGSPRPALGGAGIASRVPPVRRVQAKLALAARRRPTCTHGADAGLRLTASRRFGEGLRRWSNPRRLQTPGRHALPARDRSSVWRRRRTCSSGEYLRPRRPVVLTGSATTGCPRRRGPSGTWSDRYGDAAGPRRGLENCIVARRPARGRRRSARSPGDSRSRHCATVHRRATT